MVGLRDPIRQAGPVPGFKLVKLTRVTPLLIQCSTVQKAGPHYCNSTGTSPSERTKMMLVTASPDNIADAESYFPLIVEIGHMQCITSLLHKVHGATAGVSTIGECFGALALPDPDNQQSSLYRKEPLYQRH